MKMFVLRALNDAEKAIRIEPSWPKGNIQINNYLTN